MCVTSTAKVFVPGIDDLLKMTEDDVFGGCRLVL